MDFRILGSLEVYDNGRPLSLGGHQQRALLALLLLRANQVVPVDEIVEDLWGAQPPASATKSVQALVSENPLRERLQGQLMLALYRSGRQAEALQLYQRARHTLVDELGIEPGQALQRLEQAILQQDGSLDLLPPEIVAARRRVGLSDPGPKVAAKSDFRR